MGQAQGGIHRGAPQELTPTPRAQPLVVSIWGLHLLTYSEVTTHDHTAQALPRTALAVWQAFGD